MDRNRVNGGCWGPWSPMDHTKGVSFVLLPVQRRRWRSPRRYRRPRRYCVIPSNGRAGVLVATRDITRRVRRTIQTGCPTGIATTECRRRPGVGVTSVGWAVGRVGSSESSTRRRRRWRQYRHLLLISRNFKRNQYIINHDTHKEWVNHTKLFKRFSPYKGGNFRRLYMALSPGELIIEEPVCALSLSQRIYYVHETK